MPIALFSFMPVIMIPDPKMEIEEQVEGNYSIWGSDDSSEPRENLFDEISKGRIFDSFEIQIVFSLSLNLFSDYSAQGGRRNLFDDFQKIKFPIFHFVFFIFLIHIL